MEALFIRCLLLLSLFVALPAHAQWKTQNQVLAPGWNAVYLFVDASSQTLDTLVGFNPGCPIDQIWQWKTLPSTAQYITTPANPLLGGSQWLTYYRPGTGISTLAALSPNAAYLVHSSATTNYNWAVQGVPTPPNYLWDNRGLNFIGYSTPDSNPPTFQKFLSPVPAFASAVQVFQYGPGDLGNGNPFELLSYFTTTNTRGKAFWVTAPNINNAYYGPFSLTLPNASGFNFFDTIGQFTMQLQNITTNNLTVTATLLPSETPPFGQTSIVGVPPLLVQGALNATNLTYAYTALGGNSNFSWTLAPVGKPGSQIAVVLGINRFALTAAAGSLYAGTLQFNDSLGLSQVNVPVSATAANNAGLWVGAASVSQVGQYLKTYATNTDGTFQYNTVSSSGYTTNPTVLLATNLFINSLQRINQTNDNFTISNRVFNTYITNRLTVTTNSYVVGTNISYFISQYTNTIITTTVTDYDYINNVWLTTVATNVVAAPATTNTVLWAKTNVVVVLTNNTPVLFTNTVVNIVSGVRATTTNGLFLNPVTNSVAYGPTTNALVSAVTTNQATRVVSTNLLSTPGLTTTSSTTVYYATTNLQASVTATTNYYPTTQPFNVLTNGPNWLVFYMSTNLVVSTNTTTLAFNTNVFAITNSFVVSNAVVAATGSRTNLVSAQRISGLPNTVVSSSTNRSYAYNTVPSKTLTPNAALNDTSYVVSSLNTNLGAVPTAYPLRLILFNNGSSCSLLQRVYFGLRQQTNIVVATTERVLDTATLDSARRISSTILPWTAANTPIPFTGTLAQNSVLTVTITQAYDDQAANPYLHTFHPDHNNLNYASTPPTELPKGSQSYDIAQTISLLVTPNTLDFLTLTKGNSQLTGQYTEVITLTGLNGAMRTFNTAGTFSLNRISTVSTLTTQ